MLLALSSCSKVSPVNKDGELPVDAFVVPTNRMTQDYEVIELSVPEELKIDVGWDSHVLSIQDNDAYFMKYKFRGLGAAGGLFPTDELYVYHIDTQETELLSEYPFPEWNPVQDIRLIDGDLYEIRHVSRDKQSYVEVVYNHQVIQSNRISDVSRTFTFANVGGKLQYYMTNTENDEYMLYLYELDKGKITELYREQFDLLAFSYENEGVYIRDMYMPNSKDLLAFGIKNEVKNEFTMLVYDGKEVSKVLIPFGFETTCNFTPLTNGILIQATKYIDEKDVTDIYWYNHSTKTIELISDEHSNLRDFKQVSNNAFMATNKDRGSSFDEDHNLIYTESSILIAALEEGQLKTRVLDKAPLGHYQYGKISDSQDFVVSKDFGTKERKYNEYRFYIINWLN